MGILKAYAEHRIDKASRALMKRARRARALEEELKGLTDEELLERAKRAREAKCADEAEALALGREAVRREEGLELTDEQLACALALMDGCVAEASTGSGKTLAAMPAAFALAARFGQCRVVTVNEYLVARDAEEASRVLGRLGVTVEATLAADEPAAKHANYAADVVYGTASEFGVDYLRDGLVRREGDIVQHGRPAAIIDEVDSVLIDDARTPLVISGASGTSMEEAKLVANAVRDLDVERDLVIDEAERTVSLTPRGEQLVEKMLPWRVRSSASRANLVRQALAAEYLWKRDRDYIVADGEVKIVDEQTGRVMEGRRWNDGLHAAVEAKEGVEVHEEAETVATVTTQNYFRAYEHLSGMTGTAMSEDAEFERVFGISVVRIPDHVPSRREDLPDVFYADAESRLAGVVDDICRRHEAGQPVLVGTQSVEASDEVAAALRERGIEVAVLNARDNASEAAIVAAAGKPGRVTVSTNMAGRGTDIELGGSPEWDADAALRALGSSLSSVSDVERADRVAAAKKRCDEMRDAVVAAGGLAVVSVGRNQNRRIDDQLRGRAGRQGDVGCSQYFVSLDDDLLRLFNTDAVEKAKKSLRRAEGGSIRSKALSGIVEGAQERLSERDAEARRQMLEYDDVTAAQEGRFRAWRMSVIEGGALSALDEMATSVDAGTLAERCDGKSADEVMAGIRAKLERAGEAADGIACALVLHVADRAWARHLTDEEALKRSCGLAGVAGRDPLVEYKRESSRLEEEMRAEITLESVVYAHRSRVVSAAERRAEEAGRSRADATRRRLANAGLASALAPMASTGEQPAANRAQRRAAKKRKSKR